MFKDRLQEILEFTKSESPYSKANKGWINQDIFLEFGKSSSALSKQKEAAKVTLLWPPIQRLISNLLIIIIISSLIVLSTLKGSQLNFNLGSLSVALKDKLVQIDTKKSNLISEENQIIDINFKSDGVIGRNEFRYNPELKAGDTVEVLVEKQEDKNGQLILSHRRARVLRAWEKVNTAQDTGEIVEGTIKSRTKGGMIVEVFGIEAFLPGSQIDVKPIRDYDEYVGKKMEFKVLKVNEAFRNVVVSHKALIEADIEEQKKEIMSKLEKGQVLEGIVKNTTSYGVFIDLGGVDGLIHITDLSWGRIAHPDEIVTLDEKINVVILNFDEEKKRIQLGLKQLSKHPWDSLDENLKVGDKIKGKVVVVADYGVFVEIQPGIEALLHVSEMSWSTHLRSANDFFKVGDELDAQILTLDKEERKMSLGIKQMQEDPWSVITKKFPVDSKHKVKVINFTNFGIFVELDEGIDGLVHISHNGGSTWANITPPGLPEWSLISMIEVSTHDAGKAYLAATRYKLDDNQPILYKTRDYGATWDNISKGIPEHDFTRAIREDPCLPGMLYVGTETGIYVSFNDGHSWHSLQANLPKVPIYDLAVKDDDLIAATHGRSFWILDDVTQLRQVAMMTTEVGFKLLKPRDTYRVQSALGDRKPVSGKHYQLSVSEEATASIQDRVPANCR